MTTPIVFSLSVTDATLVAVAVGYLQGAVSTDSEADVRHALEKLDLTHRYENKNDLLAALRALTRRCAAQVDDQTV